VMRWRTNKRKLRLDCPCPERVQEKRLRKKLGGHHGGLKGAVTGD